MYNKNKLIQELLWFLKKTKRQTILVQEYMNETSNRIIWTEQRKKDFYNALEKSNIVELSYLDNQKRMSVATILN